MYVTTLVIMQSIPSGKVLLPCIPHTPSTASSVSVHERWMMPIVQSPSMLKYYLQHQSIGGVREEGNRWLVDKSDDGSGCVWKSGNIMDLIYVCVVCRLSPGYTWSASCTCPPRSQPSREDSLRAALLRRTMPDDKVFVAIVGVEGVGTVRNEKHGREG